MLNGAKRTGLASGAGRALATAAGRLRADITFAVVDLFVIVAGYSIANTLRLLDRDVVDVGLYWGGFALLLPYLIAVHLLANVMAGAYGHVWEFASISEARQVVVANGVAAMAVVAAVRVVNALDPAILPVFPLSVAVSGSLIVLLGMGLVRFRSRLFSLRRSTVGAAVLPTLVVGTGKEAADFAREASRLSDEVMVVGFISSGPAANGKRLAGLPVVGSLPELPALIGRHGIQQVVVAGDAHAALIRRVVDVCMDVDVRLRVAPGASAVLDGKEGPIDIRDIEYHDLLPRAEVATDLGAVCDLIRGKRVMITGAGGSIGSEILKQVVGFAPAEVIALDNDETHLHDALLRVGHSDLITSTLCDIRQADKVMRLVERHRPQVVFHAAALKHVPVLESFPEEAIWTNVVGTRNLIEAVSKAGAERFVLISTDKAVEPSSVMGATKRIAEMLTQAANVRRDGCVYTCVRFGNVLGSRGSVVPTFVQQIHRGGPVTITHEQMTRFFMTVPESVELVLQATTVAVGGEVLVLDMGEPVRIIDLARRLIRLAGLVPGRDIDIVTTGIRPGEKLTEILSELPLQPSSHPKIMLARPPAPGPVTLLDTIDALVQAAADTEAPELAEIVNKVARLAGVDEVVDLRPVSEHAAVWI